MGQDPLYAQMKEPILSLKEKGETVNMCTLLRSVLREGELKGKAQGLEQGKAQVIATLVESMPIEQVAELLHVSVDEIKKYL